MISLLQTATEMDRLESLNRATAEAYQFAIQSSAEYAVELDAQDASAFRRNLETLARQFAISREPGQIRKVQSSFRGELRQYQETSSARIEALRAQIKAGAAAMEALAGSLAESEEGHGTQLRNELEHLRKISEWTNLQEIRRGILGVISGFSEALDRMRKANQMAILQLQDEIRLLHQEREASCRAASTDVVTGSWNREKGAERLENLLGRDDPFAVLLISIRNLPRLEGRVAPRVIDAALRAMVRRLRGLTIDPVSRRSEAELMVFLDGDPSAGTALSREAASKLSEIYAIQDAGESLRVTLEVATGVVERAAGMEAAAFLKKLDQLSNTLARG